jgi:hypothetical protein
MARRAARARGEDSGGIEAKDKTQSKYHARAAAARMVIAVSSDYE